MISVLDLVWAWSLVDPAASRAVRVAPAYRVIVAVAPLWLWAILVGVVGILCGIQCWLQDDRAAFAAAIGWKLVWAALTLAAWPAIGVAVIRPTIVFVILGGIVSVCAAGLPFRMD